MIATTKVPWAVDPVFRKRFPMRIYVHLPDKFAREEFLRKELSKKGIKSIEEEIQLIANKTENYSFGDMINMLKEVSQKEKDHKLQIDDFLSYLSKTKSSVTEDELSRMTEFTNEFGYF